MRSASLRAYAALRHIPELYTVVDGTIVDLSADARAAVRANPLQAWAIAGLLDVVGRESEGKPIR